MNKKTVITVIVIIFLLSLGTGIIYWYWQSQSKISNTNQEQGQDQISKDNSSQGVLPTDKISNKSNKSVKPATIDNNLLSSVRYFVERWGTYSNQSDFQNVRDLRPIMTEDFFDEVYKNYKPKSEVELSKQDYEGYETKVVSIDLENQTDAEATVLVTTNRRHLVGSDSVETYPQKIRITLVKQAGVWRVATAIWQDK